VVALRYVYGLIFLILALPLIIAPDFLAYTASSPPIVKSITPNDMVNFGGAELGEYFSGPNPKLMELTVEVNAIQASGSFDLLVYNLSQTGGSRIPASGAQNVQQTPGLAKVIISQELTGGRVSYVEVTPNYKAYSVEVVIRSLNAVGKVSIVFEWHISLVPAYLRSVGFIFLLTGILLIVAAQISRRKR